MTSLLPSLIKLLKKVVSFLEKNLGLKVLVLPPAGVTDRPAGISDEAWFYHADDLEQNNRYKALGAGYEIMQGQYVPRYRSRTVVSESGSVQLDDPTSRPFGDKDLLLLRNDSPKYIILHEVLHFLIEQGKRKDSTVSDKERREQEKAAVSLEPNDYVGERGEAQRKKNVAFQREGYREELAINLTLIKRANELGLDFPQVQALVTTVIADERMRLGARIKELEIVRAQGGEFGKTAAQLQTSLRAAMGEAHEDRDKALRDFVPGWKLLDKLTRQGIFLMSPNYESSDPNDVLGISELYRGRLSAAQIKSIFRYRVFETHPDHNGGSAERFKKVNEAAELLQKGWPPLRSRYAGTEAQAVHARAVDLMAARLARTFGRFVGTCATVAAYCMVDEHLPWSVSRFGFDYNWTMFGLSLAAAAVSQTLPTVEEIARRGGVQALEEELRQTQNPMRQGMRSGIVRGLFIGGCYEALKIISGL